jgi:hypothetical protein
LDNPEAFAPVLAAAQRLLSKTTGREVRLGNVARLSDDDRRNLLLRARDVAGGSPGTFIIKQVVVDTYDPENVESWDTRRFFSDWGGAQFLSATLGTSRSPRFYGGDYSLGFFILEDLGDQRSLVEPLLEEDAASAERALLSFAACLGSVHAGTIGESADFEKLLRAIAPHVGVLTRAATGFRERAASLQVCLDGLGVRAETTFRGDVEAVAAAIEDPGPFFSYIHGDPCPDNISWTGDELRLIDFEFGGFGHALIDATYGRMLFPTCWCASALPKGVVLRMESIYRAELANGCPEAEDDQIFGAAMTKVCGFWLLSTLGRDLARALEADGQWGIATMRQRLLARLQAFIATAEECGQLPALRGTASRLLSMLETSWPETLPLPLYPAFQAPPSGRTV